MFEDALSRNNAEGATPTSLYLHTPFCAHKCHYCDFYSFVDTRDRQGPFVNRLTREIRALATATTEPIRTVFVGGGTPSLLALDLWDKLLDELRDAFEFSDQTEFTVECNPESTTPELLHLLAEHGVNRISMGAQSFDRDLLRTLERRHNPERVPKVVEWANAAGIERLSLDLIYAVPGQTRESLKHDLEAALALGTEHLSCYALTYEPGTAMTARRERAEFTPIDEDTEADMFEFVAAELASRGLARYETSNFARPGRECRHNLAYWRQEQWLAAGPSASAHVGGHRWKNVPRLGDYLEFDDMGFSVVVDHEPPDPARALADRVMMGIRLSEGIDWARLTTEAGELDTELPSRLTEALGPWLERGTADLSEDRLRTTESGAILADGIARDLIACLR